MALRTHHKISTFLIPMVIIAGFYWYYSKHDYGTLIISGIPPYEISVNNENYQVAEESKTIELRSGEYRISIIKPGYEEIFKEIEIEKNNETEVYADFEFIPYTEEINIYQYQLPEDKMNTEMYFDNQAEFFLDPESYVDNPSFSNLPENVGTAIFSPNGKAIFLETWKGEDIFEFQRYLYLIKEDELFELDNNIDTFNLPKWSPQGDKLAYLKLDYNNKLTTLSYWTLENPAETQDITKYKDSTSLDFAWSSDQTEIALFSMGDLEDNYIYLVDVLTGQKHRIGNENKNAGINWSPDGRNILIAKRPLQDLDNIEYGDPLLSIYYTDLEKENNLPITGYANDFFWLPRLNALAYEVTERYLHNMENYTSAIYTFKLSSNSIQKLYQLSPHENMEITAMQMSEDGKELWVRGENTGLKIVLSP